MVSSKTTLAGVVTLLFGGANAHGYLGLPAVTFPDTVDKTQFIATIEASTSGFAGSFDGSPAVNTAAFETAFNSSKYSSLKLFIADLGQIVASGANIECGLTDPNETPQPIPDHLEWTHSDTEGFTSSHEGPCEAWCDDTLVFKDGNCAAHYTTAPAKMPYDQASCSGASRLTFYWLALHSSTWQVYVDCAALEGGSGSYSSNSTTSESTGQSSNTPTVTTATPTTSSPKTTTATLQVTPSSPTPTTTQAPISDSSSFLNGSDEEDCGSLDVAGSDEEDCGSLDVAGSDDDQVGADADMDESDCGSLDVAGSDDDEDCGSLDVAGSDEEDCGSLDVAGSEGDESTSVSESSLNFDNVDDGSYKSGKVQPQQ